MRLAEHTDLIDRGGAGRDGDTLLEIDQLRTVFATPAGIAPAVDGVSLTLRRGRTLGLVGESGCGKSVTALSIMRLLPPPGRIVGGTMRYDDRDLVRLAELEMRRIRGSEIAMIFQEPMTSLNPVLTVGWQVAEGIRVHRGVGRRAAWTEAVEMLRQVDIPDPAARARSYPHQLSGGMRQRVMIAMAMSCAPRLLIADEPTTALDVTIQAQILDLLRTLQTARGTAVLLITHDLGIVAEQAHEVVIMYAGRVVERAPAAALFARPLHPYTIGLIASVPGLGGRRRRLEGIPGMVPDPLHFPTGCRFRDRCTRAVDRCATIDPPLEEKAPGHHVACIVV
jgi:oligopeptide/dipeptide ABC transporter ATP-binding protein